MVMLPGRRRLRLLAGTILVAYLALLALLYFLQDALIFPGRASQGRPEARIPPRSDREILRLRTRSGEEVAAVFGAALTPSGHPLADPRSRPSVVYFYGNGQFLAGEMDHLATIRRLGVNVIMADYLGYGMSGGRASEAGCYATADSAYDYLLSRPDVDPRKIVAGGFSLGGAVAIDLASRRPVAGVIVSGTFADLVQSAQARYRIVPVSLLLRHRFASLEKIRSIRAPMLIAHGTLDPIVPIAASDLLVSAALGPVTRIVRPDLGHADVIRFADAATLETVGRFLDAIAATP